MNYQPENTIYEPTFEEAKGLSLLCHDSGFHYDFWKKWEIRNARMVSQEDNMEVNGILLDTQIFCVAAATLLNAAAAALGLHQGWKDRTLGDKDLEFADNRAEKLNVTSSYGINL